MSDTNDPNLDPEQILGPALAEALAPAGLTAARRAALRERVMARAAGGAGLRTVRGGEAGWVATSPLTELRPLRTEDGATHRTIMFRLRPGGEFPAHSHPFEEETYVIEGEIEVGEEILRAGDYQFAAPGSFHQTIRSPKGAMLLIRFQNRAAAEKPG